MVETIQLELTLDDQEFKRLSAALARSGDVAELAKVIGQAGATELLALASGNAVFSNMGDLRSFRIFCLLRQGVSMADAEAVVAALFKVTPPTARRLVREALARYSVELDDDVRGEVVAALESAAWDKEDDRWLIRLRSGLTRDRVNEVLNGMDLPEAIAPPRGAIWRLANEAFQEVRREFGLGAKEPERVSLMGKLRASLVSWAFSSYLSPPIRLFQFLQQFAF